VHRDSAGRGRLGTVREHGMRNEGMQRQPLQAYFAFAIIHNPDDAELRFDLTHPNIENFTGSNLSLYALNYQTADTHVGDKSVLGKGLAMSIHSPNLYRELNFDSWAKSSIHGRHCAL
jgi:hypothetical protein